MPRALPPRAVLAAALGLVAALAGCTGRSTAPRAEDPRRPTITVASFDFPESETLAELYGQALRGGGYPVEVISRLGSREIVEPALEQGKVDLVPEYMGSALDFLGDLALAASADPRQTHARLEQAFGPRGVSVLAYAPAQDRNGFVVTAQTARTYRLRRVSDLGRVAGRFALGGPPECPERPLCLQGLERTYGLHFERFEPMPTRTVTATALEEGEIDVGMIDTTDANLATRELLQLADDRRLQPADNLVPVVRRQVLDAYGPRLVRLLDSVTAPLTTPALIGLNRQVEVDELAPASVAAAWLRAHPPAA
ncbi:MAG TPA: ABC transporter substrate-binding protein [Actinomycetes bacterium]|jgi:osmoprotectant transport system substrate-binding protein|nr:ABC transporter substrate-binding protein [Actinomycetes bacterium]